MISQSRLLRNDRLWDRLKTGTGFGADPIALNWAQMLGLFPVTMAWVRESLKRDRAIRATLDECG